MESIRNSTLLTEAEWIKDRSDDRAVKITVTQLPYLTYRAPHPLGERKRPVLVPISTFFFLTLDGYVVHLPQPTVVTHLSFHFHPITHPN